MGQGKDAEVYKIGDTTFAAKCFSNKPLRDSEFEKHIHIVQTLDGLRKSLKTLKFGRYRQAFDAVAKAMSLSGRSIAKVYHSSTLYSIDGCSEYYCTVLKLEGQKMEEQLTSANPPPFLEVLEHAYQLIGALFCIHKTGYQHNDLNTDNILQRYEGNGYVIVDFGESEKSGTEVRNDLCYNQYSPPDRNRYHRGSFDVASLGSILVELLVWGILGGVDVILQFRKEREADQIEHQQGQNILDTTERFYINAEGLSPSVERWLGRLEKVIPEVVAVLQDMLHIDPDRRPTAMDAFIRFGHAFQQLTNHPTPN